TAFIGDLSAAATASGEVVTQRDARITPLASGTVAHVYVAVGDQVEAGDVLLELETADLQRALASAQQSLLIQENNLAKLLEPAAAADIAAAEASVANAQATLASLQAGPTPEEIAGVEADVRAANADIAAANARLNNLTSAPDPDALYAAQLELELAQTAATQAAEQHSTILVTEPNDFLSEDDLAEIEVSLRTQAVQANAQLAAAQEALDQLQNGDANSIASAQASVAAAVAQRDLAQLQLDQLLAGASAAQIAAAESNVAQAQANLDALQRGPTDAQIVAAEVAIEQARVSVQRAEINLERATLTAPFAGTVTAVHVNEGEIASGIVIELVDTHNLEVILSVDEVDLADLSVGQPAAITLETWPDDELDGRITAIAPAATSDNSALVTYDVYLSLGETDLPVLVGMTANADITTRRSEDVLLLPNAAINVDRSAGTYSVHKVTRNGDQPISISETTITIGLRDGQYTQITSGLQAGDEVMVGDVLPVFTFGPGNGDPGNGGPFGGGQ
ncbi:MAG: HlyD family efflux transporter periplasmic adaptor subunit, partial [Anaerolineales bacterium]|nr:HlyD family efflux transporter periplasmic adaptor subunit [Anaerolineales bacterium]